jgi:hypothetical protein
MYKYTTRAVLLLFIHSCSREKVFDRQEDLIACIFFKVLDDLSSHGEVIIGISHYCSFFSEAPTNKCSTPSLFLRAHSSGLALCRYNKSHAIVEAYASSTYSIPYDQSSSIKMERTVPSPYRRNFQTVERDLSNPNCVRMPRRLTYQVLR